MSPCSIYKGKQRALCYLTDEWEDWSGVRKKKYKKRYKRGGHNRTKRK